VEALRGSSYGSSPSLADHDVADGLDVRFVQIEGRLRAGHRHHRVEDTPKRCAVKTEFDIRDVGASIEQRLVVAKAISSGAHPPKKRQGRQTAACR
jgi:hypothetical protein